MPAARTARLPRRRPSGRRTGAWTEPAGLGSGPVVRARLRSTPRGPTTLGRTRAARPGRGGNRAGRERPGTASGRDDHGTVLAVHPSPDGYGADLQLVQAVSALVVEGWRVVVVLPHPGPLVDRLTDAGAETAFVDYPVLRKASANPVALVRLLLAAVACLPRAIRLVRRVRPVHCWSTPSRCRGGWRWAA